MMTFSGKRMELEKNYTEVTQAQNYKCCISLLLLLLNQLSLSLDTLIPASPPSFISIGNRAWNKTTESP